MKKKNIYVFLFDGFSDWEISYLTPEINKSEHFNLIFLSETEKLITSMGGLQIKPTATLSNVKQDEIDMLILPGGKAWEIGQYPEEIVDLTKGVLNKGKSIAAICAGTTFLGQLGLLDDIEHTSNQLDYLKGVASNYRGEKKYKEVLAITSDNIITANGITPIEFSKEIFKNIDLYDEKDIEKWFQLFKNGVWSGA